MVPILAFDRLLMAFSLAVHIVLASVGIALPVIVVTAEVIGIRKGDRRYTTLARRFSLVLIVLFAIGAASGTLVAVELFFLWPAFAALLGQVAILPIYVEVFAFFLEAIFLAAYVFSWDKIEGYLHVGFGVLVAIGAAASGALITMVNAFMNTPVGFNIPAYLQSGIITGINPLAVFTSPAVFIEVTHVLATSYFAGAFVFCGYFAFRLLRAKGKAKEYYKIGVKLTFAIVVVATALSVITGIMSINSLATIQPEKYAALEANFVAQANAPEIIGGFLINGTLRYYLSIPGLQSQLLGGPGVVTPGLNNYQQSTWPPFIVHNLFDIMVFLGFGFALPMILVIALFALRYRPLERRWVLWLFVAGSLFALLLLELGWTMAEIARQPWIIYNVMTVGQAANYSGASVPFAILFIAIYIVIIPLTLLILRGIFKSRPLSKELVG